MHRWVRLSEHHWTVLLVVFASCATVVAWISFGLINMAMANFDFVTRHGLMGLRDGGLLQLLEISAKASVVLGAYLLFKAIETELIARWRNAGK
jgi:hypothetical protein